MYNDYLQHYGVKGMKWGRRKSDYSDEDSISYKYNKSGESGRVGAKRSVKAKVKSRRDRNIEGWSAEAKEAYGIKKRTKGNVNLMTNAELKKLNERDNLVQNYKRLNPGVTEQTKRRVAGVVATAGAVATFVNVAAPNYKKAYKAVKGLFLKGMAKIAVKTIR